MKKKLRDSHRPHRVAFLMFCPAIISALFTYYVWDMVGALGAILIQISVLLSFKFVIDHKEERLLGEVQFSEDILKDYESKLIYTTHKKRLRR